MHAPGGAESAPFLHSLSVCVGSTRCVDPRGGVRIQHYWYSRVLVVCVASLSVIQLSDYWSDPMAIAGLLVWGSGAPRRRQRPLDNTGSSQSCPAASEHGSGSVSRFRSTSSFTRWSVFSFRETLSARSMRWLSTAREPLAHLRRRRRHCFSITLAHRGARLRPASLPFALFVARSCNLEGQSRAEDVWSVKRKAGRAHFASGASSDCLWH